MTPPKQRATQKRSAGKKALTIDECIVILKVLYHEDHLYPLGLGIRQSIEYLKMFKNLRRKLK